MITRTFHHRPSTLRFMAQALLPSPGLRGLKSLPELHLRWQNWRVDERTVEKFFRLCGMPASRELPIIFPQTSGLPLIMALLTHPKWPEPIWGSLQIRNRLRQVAPLRVGDVVDLDVKPVEYRILRKGGEIDLLLTVSRDGAPIWEGRTTSYYRGNFGAPTEPPADTFPPETPRTEIARWTASRGGGFEYGGISGDYNGIHLWSPYARLFGFPSAFFHPHRPVGQALAQSPPIAGPEDPQTLDLWFRGPVPYGTEVRLTRETVPGGDRFAIFAAGESRPSIIAARTAAPAPR